MIFKVRWFLLSRLTKLGEDVGNGGRNSFSELLGHLDTMWSREYCWAWCLPTVYTCTGNNEFSLLWVLAIYNLSV